MIGRLFGSRVVKKAHSRFLNRRALERTHQFYRRHGGKIPGELSGLGILLLTTTGAKSGKRRIQSVVGAT